MKIRLLLLFGCLISITSYCQQNLKRLIKSAIIPGTVVYKMPLTTLFLSKGELWSYRSNIEELKEHVDSTVILEIISNSIHMDSSQWTESEMPNVILIEKISDRIPKRKIKATLKKVQPSPASDFKNFNNTPIEKRNVLSYSKPVFDNSRNYAVIAYKETLGWGAIIYHFVNNHWLKLGDLVRWVV